jgi:hypothetical protein
MKLKPNSLASRYLAAIKEYLKPFDPKTINDAKTLLRRSGLNPNVCDTAQSKQSYTRARKFYFESLETIKTDEPTLF